MKGISLQNLELIFGAPSRLEVPESWTGWNSWMKIVGIYDLTNAVVFSLLPLQDDEAVSGSS
jgi:hypothetical protein